MVVEVEVPRPVSVLVRAPRHRDPVPAQARKGHPQGDPHLVVHQEVVAERARHHLDSKPHAPQPGSHPAFWKFVFEDPIHRHLTVTLVGLFERAPAGAKRQVENGGGGTPVDLTMTCDVASPFLVQNLAGKKWRRSESNTRHRDYETRALAN